MPARHSLRLRIAAIFAVFGGLISITQATGMYIASHNLEEELIDDTLAAELQDFSARRARNPSSVPEMTSTIRAYVISKDTAAEVPATVQALSPGRFQITLAGVPYRAAVAQAGNERLAILYDESMVLEREQKLIALLVAGALLTSLLAAIAGFWISGRVIAPVTDLVRRVANLRPEHKPTPLAQHYPWNEIRALAQDFDDYLTRLRAFIEREQAFTGDVSHELRTPLAIIDGAAEVLLADPKLPESALSKVTRIVRASREATEITSALLVLARERTTPRTTSESCSVADVVRDVIASLSALQQLKTVSLELDIQAEPYIPVEKAVLAMVIGNLLRNAFAHTDHGEVNLVLNENSLRVTDTGIGIEPELLPKVFDQYYSGAHSDSTGIGLSLVRRICDHYHWKISIDSTPGRGTTTCLVFADFGANCT